MPLAARALSALYEASGEVLQLTGAVPCIDLTDTRSLSHSFRPVSHPCSLDGHSSKALARLATHDQSCMTRANWHLLSTRGVQTSSPTTTQVAVLRYSARGLMQAMVGPCHGLRSTRRRMTMQPAMKAKGADAGGHKK